MTTKTRAPTPRALLNKLYAHWDCATWVAFARRLEVSETQVSRWRRGGKMGRLWREKIEGFLESKR